MMVTRGWSNDPSRSLMKPLPTKNGLFIEFRGGDICDPMNGKWFEEPYPTIIWKWFSRFTVLPFISWRCGKKGGYIGFKAYGVDSPAYKNWIDPSEIYDGSQALCFSVRPFATIRE